MNKQIVSTPTAPAAIGPYSQAVKTGLVVFLSGQIGLDPATQQLAGEDFGTQVRQAFRMLLASRGADLAYGRKLPRLLREAGFTRIEPMDIRSQVLAFYAVRP